MTSGDKDLQIAVKDIIREDSKREKCKINFSVLFVTSRIEIPCLHLMNPQRYTGYS